jgi:hypothetical protein
MKGGLVLSEETMAKQQGIEEGRSEHLPINVFHIFARTHEVDWSCGRLKEMGASPGRAPKVLIENDEIIEHSR